MLNGVDPILIIQLSVLAPILGDSISKIPYVSKVPDLIKMPPVPIYLSQRLTGLHIDTEEKNVDIQTTTETMTDGSSPQVDQKALGSVVVVMLEARKDSVGLSLLSALVDRILPKVTSKEYSITYLHGPITIFNGLLHSYSVMQESGSEKLTVKLEISKGGDNQPTKPDPLPKVPGNPGAVPIDFTPGAS